MKQAKYSALPGGKRKTLQAKFGKSGDYEDVTVMNGQVIVLKSDGTLFSFKEEAASSEKVEPVSEWSNLVPEAEYEGLYGDEAAG
jgi:tellurite resistance-related uncharacterized protein